MDGWRDRLPILLLAASGALVAALLLYVRPDDISTVIVALSMVVILLAAPVAFALRAIGAPAGVVRRVVPAGVLTGGVLLVAGMAAEGWRWLLAFVLGVAGIELATLAAWAVVALLGRLRERVRDRVVRRRRS